MRPRSPFAAAAVAALLLFVPPASATEPEDPPPAPCSGGDFDRLDFWLGDWEVRVGDQVAGTNRIEKILAGCAILEHWSSAGGGEGKSLFYLHPGEGEWKQVWITEDSTRPGGIKEKRLLERLEGGGVIFRGEIVDPERGTYLDQTLLTPEEGGRVRQVIQISTDGGESWRSVWDSIYVPTAAD